MLSDLLGKQYDEGGRGPDVYDCYGLCLEISRRVGRRLPDISTPSDLQQIHAAFLKNSAVCRRLHEPRPHCVVAFVIRAPYVTHMGIVMEDCRRFMHILRGRCVAVERLDSLSWKRRIAGYYEFENHQDNESI